MTADNQRYGAVPPLTVLECQPHTYWPWNVCDISTRMYIYIHYNLMSNCSDLFDICFVLVVCCRSHAIACVNQFIISRTQALMLHIDPFIEVPPPNLTCQKLEFCHVLNLTIAYYRIMIQKFWLLWLLCFLYLCMCLCTLEPVCTGRWWGARSEEERVQSFSHAFGSPTRPSPSSNAQHHRG